MLTKKIFKFLLLVSINFCFISNSFAITPYLFVQETADEATEALNKRLSKEEKMEKLKIIAKKTVDIKGIGNYSLGTYRKTLSDQKKDEYFEIFINSINKFLFSIKFICHRTIFIRSRNS